MANDLASYLSGLGNIAGSWAGGWVGDQIIKNTSESKLSDMISGFVNSEMKKLQNVTDKKIDFWSSPEPTPANRLYDFCGDGCKYRQTKSDIPPTLVQSTIKFGE